MACDWAVGRNLYHVELIDVPELTGLGAGSTCHTRKLVVHTEVVLQGDGGKGLCGSLYLDMLLGLDSLVQAVAPASAFHDTACLLVDNLHLAVHHDVFVVLVEHGVGLQELLQGVHALALYAVVSHHLVLDVETLLVADVGACLELAHLCGDVGQHEELTVVHLLGEPFGSLVGEVGRVEFLVYDEV